MAWNWWLLCTLFASVCNSAWPLAHVLSLTHTQVCSQLATFLWHTPLVSTVTRLNVDVTARHNVARGCKKGKAEPCERERGRNGCGRQARGGEGGRKRRKDDEWIKNNGYNFTFLLLMRKWSRYGKMKTRVERERGGCCPYKMCSKGGRQRNEERAKKIWEMER